MNIKRTQRLLEYCMKGNVPALLIGHSGIGKSAVVEQTAKSILPNHTVIKLMASQQDIGDLIGLPYLVESTKVNSNEKNTKWARPEWMLEGPIVLFLDEVNQANRDVESALFQLVYEKRVHNHYLHQDSVVIAAINPSTSEYTTANVMSSAFIKRFVIIPFEPQAEEVLSYGKESGIFHKDLLRFMEFQNEHIALSKKLETGIPMEPTPRTQAMASKLFRAAELIDPKSLTDSEIISDILSSTLGREAAASYLAFMDSQEKPLSFEDVFDSWDQNKTKFAEFRKEGREDLVSQSVNTILTGLIGLVEKLRTQITFTGYVNDIDSEDSTLKKVRVAEVKEHFKRLLDKTKFSNLIDFLGQLPKDYFYQFSYNYMTHKIIVNEASVKDNLDRANAHQLVMLYLWSNVSATHMNLYGRIQEESSEIDSFIKAQKGV